MFCGILSPAIPHRHGDATVSIRLIDVNDNGPIFAPSSIHGFVEENVLPPVTVATLIVSDPDKDPPHGEPFTFGLAQDDGKFTLDNRTGVLRTMVTFNREEQAEYNLGVWAKDNGGMTSRTWVKVLITDVNDHQHYDGRLELTLNLYQGKFPGGRIGKVYVVDKDTDDERLYHVLSKSSRYFTVERTTGFILSESNPPIGSHRIAVKVVDANSSYQPAVSRVSIFVKNIPAEALDRSIAVRLAGLSQEDIVANFLASFKETVAEILGTHEENVDVFSVQMAPGPHGAVDVRFAAHGSPYYAPERILALLKNERHRLSSIAQNYGVKYEAIGVDKCLTEPCKFGSCTNVLTADGSFEVINADDKTFTSLLVTQKVTCGTCGANKEATKTCQSKPCLNGGTCHQFPKG